ncbi:hypothetical protein F4677DRAFT_461477 [Hypoxylon crocopeplum]|nr:hypothetical protein F4677DRAFT_461477 [Hypoxylon crocopeplum]
MSTFTSSTAQSVSTAPSTALTNPNHEDPIISFTNMQNLFEAIDCVSGDILIVINVSTKSFDEIEEQRIIRRRKIRWCRYEAGAQILLITIPTSIHEILHTQLYEEYIGQLPASGVPRRAWLSKAATYFHSNHPGGGGGECDSTGGPKSQRLRSRDWPTLIIKAGVSESLNQLHADMKWWFAASNHDVKIVILTKFNQQQSKIILGKWEEQAETRLGATTTRRAATLQPVLLQTIEITRNTTTNPVSYNVTSGAMVLEFSLLFLRNPGPLEGDVVISVQFLQEYAELVWSQD